MALLPFLKYLFNDVPLDYQGPETGWHVVPNYTQISTQHAGKYRLHALPGGFLSAWGDLLVARDRAGRELWRLTDPGRPLAFSPTRHQLLAFDAFGYEYRRFDARTGELLERFQLAGDAPLELLWLPDGRLVVGNGVRLLVFDRQRQLQRTLRNFGPDGADASYLQALTTQAAYPAAVLCCDNNGGRVFRLDLDRGQVTQQSPPLPWPNLYPTNEGRDLLVYTHHEYVRLDPANLQPVQKYPFAGLDGVRTEAEMQHQQSCAIWEKRAAASPDGKHLLAIDNSGLLWLFDAKSGYQLRIFRRELVDFAFDVLWLSPTEFVALCNRGHVVKQNITQLDGPVFNVVDFKADDDARHLPDPATSSASRPASDQAALQAALDTLAHGADPAAYGQALETISFADVDTDWNALLRPEHLAGALRSYIWFKPEAGFAGLEAFAEVRQRLAAAQYHVPAVAAPVAAALRLHDDLFERGHYATRRAEHYVQHIEWQLQEAYQQVVQELENAAYADDPEAVAFRESADYAQLAEAVTRTEAFVDAMGGGHSYVAHNLIERLLPQPAYLAQYEAFLRAQPPAVQVSALDPAEYHDDPQVVALLRRLRHDSPHPDVRAFAADALAKAGH